VENFVENVKNFEKALDTSPLPCYNLTQPISRENAWKVLSQWESLSENRRVVRAGEGTIGGWRRSGTPQRVLQ